MKLESEDCKAVVQGIDSKAVQRVAALTPEKIREIAGAIRKKKGSLAVPEPEFADPYSSLEEIRAKGNKRPLFLVHPAGGGVKSYHELARHLDGEQPVYAFQGHIFGSHKERPYLSIEQMAARYIHVLQVVQPAPPYLLGGWSMGGLVAFEMALQLKQQGQDVSLVAIIDSCAQMRAGAGRGPASQRLAEDLILIGTALAISEGRSLPLSLGDLEGRPEDEQFALFLRKSREQQIVSPQIDDDAVRALLKTLENSDRAIASYVHRKYSGNVAVIRASEATSAMKEAASDIYDEPAFGWQAFCEQPVSVHFVPGDHLHMMAHPCVRELGRVLQQCIDNLGGPQ